MSFTVGLAATNAGGELIRSTLELLRREEVDRTEVSARLLELQALILESRQALSDGDDANRALTRQLEEKNRVLAVLEDMEICQDGGFYVKKPEKGQGIFNPCCPVCFGVTKQAVPLVPMASGYYSCALHESASYQTKAYREAEERRIQQARADENHFEVIRGPSSWMR